MDAEATESEDLAEVVEDEEPEGNIVPHEPVTIQLIYPVMFGARRIDSLTFRPVTAKDLRRCKTPANDSVPWTLELAGFVCGEPSHVIDLLAAADALEVISVVGNFLGVSRRTGPKL